MTLNELYDSQCSHLWCSLGDVSLNFTPRCQEIDSVSLGLRTFRITLHDSNLKETFFTHRVRERCHANQKEVQYWLK